MRQWVYMAAVLCGCYAPQPPRGAPCNEDRPSCPSGQSCIAGFCGGGGGMTDGSSSNDGSLPPDMSSSTDVDGDGVPNMMDNCPMFSNPGQGNEDGDPLGDGCDPCPIDPASPPSDPDMDGVSDSCDPRPTTGGDSLTVFEGFHNGVPQNWTLLGNSMQSGDDINLSSDGSAAIVPPVAAPLNGVVSMKAKVNTTMGQFDSTVAVVLPVNSSIEDGIYCELYSPDAGSTNNRTHDLYKWPDMDPFSSKQYGWQNNTYYTFVSRRANTNYTCAVTPMGGATDTVTGNNNLTVANGKAGAFLYGASINISWLMIVTSN